MHGEHVYEVGELGLLVHNTTPECAAVLEKFPGSRIVRLPLRIALGAKEFADPENIIRLGGKFDWAEYAPIIVRMENGVPTLRRNDESRVGVACRHYGAFSHFHEVILMQQWRLLGLVLTNLRDSAFGQRLVEAKTELLLAQRLINVSAEREQNESQLNEAISIYQKEGVKGACPFTSNRADVYLALLRSPLPVGSMPSDEAVRLEIEFLTVGLGRLELFCSKGQLDLIYFAAHHLHNSPQRLVNGHAKGLRHYLKVERPFIIDRFESANVDSKLHPSTDYEEVWAEMKRLSETFSEE